MGRVTWRSKVERLLAAAGVELGGGRAWDLQVHDERFHRRVLAGGSLALGESYMDGWWDCGSLDQFFTRVLGARLDRQVATPGWLAEAIRARLGNPQAPARAFTIGERHYDLGNDLYRAMLDSRMIYSCALWERATTLDEAQEAKLELVCRKLGLEPGLRVLDIGCGWGGTARYAAERHGVEVLGITVSRQQAALARETCAGLPVEVRLEDYRQTRGTFDRVFSIGMFEHVGARNYRTFFDVARRRLRDDGLFLLHTIGGERSVVACEPWTAKHVFPNSMIPSARQIASASEGRFAIAGWQCIGPDYDPTLLAWHRNFEAHWPALRERYDERFHRLWRYYLLSSAGSFRARRNDVWQVLLRPLPRR